MPASFRLRVKQGAPGDLVAATALVRDLHAQFPGVRTSLAGGGGEELLRFDSRISPPDPAVPETVIDYRATVDRSRTDKTARSIFAAHESFGAARGIAVHRGAPRPDLVLGPAELTSVYPDPYCLVVSGTKLDITLKAWPHRYFRDVAARTKDWNWVQAGAVHDGRHLHRQVAIPNAVNMLGRTSLRDLVRLVRHAEVVLCLVSLPMLLAAAFGVPCVAVAGGREDPWLYDGLGVHYLHTVGDGRLSCCTTHGCRASAALPAHDQSAFPPGWLCADPVADDESVGVGRCMTLITPDRIVAALEAAKRGRLPLA